MRLRIDCGGWISHKAAETNSFHHDGSFSPTAPTSPASSDSVGCRHTPQLPPPLLRPLLAPVLAKGLCVCQFCCAFWRQLPCASSGSLLPLCCNILESADISSVSRPACMSLAGPASATKCNSWGCSGTARIGHPRPAVGLVAVGRDTWGDVARGAGGRREGRRRCSPGGPRRARAGTAHEREKKLIRAETAMLR